MKILFVYKGRYQVRDTVTIEYLSAIARRQGHSTCLVYDQDLFGVTDNVFSAPALNRVFSSIGRSAKKILKEESYIVVFLAGFNRDSWNEAVAREIKKQDKHLITAVVSASENKEFSEIYDHVLTGEPELVFGHYLEGCHREPERRGDLAVESGTPRLLRGFTPCNDLKVKDLVNLDALPLPDKELFAPYVNFKDSYMIYTTKGCPYNCSYCEETVYKKAFGNRYFRSRSIENVLFELETAKEKFSTQEIIFKDSVFTWDSQRLKTFLEQYEKRITLPFKCFGKAENFNLDTAMLLKRSGCYCVEFGVQTFNEDIKMKILNRTEKNDTLQEAFSACDNAGLRYDIDYMFGLPEESLEDHKQAAMLFAGFELLNRIKCHNLVYYKGSEIFKYAPAEIASSRIGGTRNDVIAMNEKTKQSDFFSHVAGTKEMRPANSAFQKLFKVLPLLPSPFAKELIKGNTWKTFKYVPSALIIVLQAILALKNRDTRFKVYMKYYPQKFAHALAGVKL